MGGRHHALRAARRTSPGAAADAGGAAPTCRLSRRADAAHRRRDAGPAPPRSPGVVDRCLGSGRSSASRAPRRCSRELEPLLPGRATRDARSRRRGPYPGLAAFQEGDADRFFGREPGHLAAWSRACASIPIAAIVGPSGVGKSSFVRAGVVPALARSGESWEVVVLRPGREPLDALATMLLHADRRHGVAGTTRASTSSSWAPLPRGPGHLGALLRRARGAAEASRCCCSSTSSRSSTRWCRTRRSGAPSRPRCRASPTTPPRRCACSSRCGRTSSTGVGEDRRFLDDVVRGLHFLQPLPREALREALEAPVEQLGYSFENAAMSTEMLDSLAVARRARCRCCSSRAPSCGKRATTGARC